MKRKPARRKPLLPILPAAEMLANLPPADRGSRWVCKRADCHRKPVNFGTVCTCCGQARK
jgi:hypothetical protein